MRSLRTAREEGTVKNRQQPKPPWNAFHLAAAFCALIGSGSADAMPGFDNGLEFKDRRGITCSVSLDPKGWSRLACSAGRMRGWTLLNTRVTEPRGLRCSYEFCAVLDRTIDTLVITIGPKDILAGRDSFGFYSGGYTHDSSYRLFLPTGVKADEIDEIRIRGYELTIYVGNNTWTIDLRDPNGSRWVIR